MTKKPSSSSVLKEINFEEWICGIIDPFIKDVESLMPENLTDEQLAIKDYWASFAQNTLNLIRIMTFLPHQFTQVMMTFRLLQEMSADIFYLKNHKKNIAELAQIDNKIYELKIGGNLSLRTMSKLIAETDIRNGSKGHGTQERIGMAGKCLNKDLGIDTAKDMNDINNFLNGYSHFNPAGIYLQKNLTEHGYIETYTKIFSLYTAWLYLVLISLSDLLDISELNPECSKDIIEDIFEKIQESNNWIEDPNIEIKVTPNKQRACQ